MARWICWRERLVSRVLNDERFLQVPIARRDLPFNPMNHEPERPADHQRLIALLQESKAPPADAETPPIPAEMLERLNERYGSTEPVRRRENVPEQESGFWSQLMALLVQPKFAFSVAALLLIAGLAVFMQPSTPEDDLVRGTNSKPGTLPVYWASVTQPKPTGLGMPKFIVIAPDQLPANANAIVCDPAQRTARLLRTDGKPGNTIIVTDPAAADEWLTAHRQLSLLANP